MQTLDFSSYGFPKFVISVANEPYIWWTLTSEHEVILLGCVKHNVLAILGF